MKNKLTMSALLILAGLMAASCAGQKNLQMVSSGDIPAAESTVNVGKSDNGNTTFDITVKHLAAPARVDPNATVYVVWLRGSESSARTQNMGALKVNDNLDGSYSGVTPLREFELFITVEPSSAGTSPTGKSLLHTTIARK